MRGRAVEEASRRQLHVALAALTMLVVALALVMTPVQRAAAFDAPPKDQGHSGSNSGGPDDDNPNDPDQDEDGDPVQIKTGNFTMAVEDFALQSFALPLVVRRSYNSLDTIYDGPLGPGWSLSYVMSIRELTEYLSSGDTVTIRTQVILRDDVGVNHIYTPIYTQQGSNLVISGWQGPRKHFGTLTRTGDGRFTWERKDGIQFRFVDGRLDEIVDTNGNRIALTYDGSGRLIRAENPAGRFFTYAYNSASKLASVTDNIGRQVTYGYDARNRLVSVTNPIGAVTTMTYDAEDRLATMTSPKGDPVLSNTYDASGRVTSQNSNGASYTYSYLATYTRVRDSRGFYTYHYFNDAGNPIQRTDPRSYNRYWVWDDAGNLTRTTDERGYHTDMVYDDVGNLLRVTYPDGGVKTFTYGALNRVTSMTDPLGRTTSYAYDPRGNQVSITDPLGQTESFTYDSAGRLLTSTDKAGNSVSFTYDGATGDMLSRTDQNGNTTSWTYDTVGRRVTQTDGLGNTTTFAYDARDRLVSITNPLGNAMTYAYDLNNDMVAETDPLGNTSTYDWTPFGFLAGRTDPLGNTFSYTYDSLGNRISVVDPEGRVTTLSYDGRNQLTRIVRGDGSTVQYAYDPAFNLMSVTDPNDNVTTFSHDSMNRRVGTSFADGSTIGVTYNLMGEVTRIVDRKGQQFDYTYDAIDRITTLALPNDGAIAYEYNPLNNVTQAAGFGGSVGYAYDPGQRIVSETGHWGAAVNYTYDAADRMVALERPGRFTFTYAYDANDRLVSGTAPSGSVSFAYDAADRLTQKSMPNGVTVTYAYDPVDRQTAVTHTAPDGTTILESFGYEFSDSSLITAMTDAFGVRTEYTYDGFYRLTSETVKASDGTVLSTTGYTYDGNGNRLSVDADGVVTDYTYNEVDELVSAGTETFTYDDNGNLVSANTPAGVVTYTYDDLDRLTGVSGGVFAPATFTYDAEGRRVARVVSGAEQRFVHHFDQVLEELDATGSPAVRYDRVFGLLAREAAAGNRYYHFDALSNTRALTDTAGAITDTYAMNAFGVSLGHTGPSDNPFIYNGNYGYYDEGQGGLVQVGVRYLQTGAGRFTSVDPLRQGNNHHAYALNNPLLYNDPNGEWVNFLIGCIAGGLTDLAIGEGMSALTGEYKDRNNWDRLKDFGAGCAMGAAGVGLAKALDRLNDLRKLQKAKKGSCCFVAGTPVKTADGFASIEELEIGDRVLAFNEETGQTALMPVVDVMVRPADDLSEPLFALTVSDGERTEVVQVTDAHPYWVPARGEWVAVRDLKVGEGLVGAGGVLLEVVDKQPAKQAATYNLSVGGYETYFAGELAALVHNCPPKYARNKYKKLTKKQKKDVLDKDPTCVYCKKNKSDTVDHVKSQKKDWDNGGYKDSRDVRSDRVNDPSNLSGACRSCNSSKGSKDLGTEWNPPGS